MLITVIAQKEEEKSVGIQFCSGVHFGGGHTKLLEMDWGGDCICLVLAQFAFSIRFKNPVPAGPSPILQANLCSCFAHPCLDDSSKAANTLRIQDVFPYIGGEDFFFKLLV